LEMRAWWLLFLLGCSAEVDEPCLYERTDVGVAHEGHIVSVYAFCDGADPAQDGSCEGANVTLERIETINTGRGHMYCVFEGPEGVEATARVVCRCP